MKKVLTTIAGIILIVLMFASTFFLLRAAWQIVRDLNETQRTLFVVALTLLAPILGSFITTNQTKKKEFEMRNREKKEKAYEDFVELVYQYVADSARGGVPSKKRFEELLESRKNLVVWASDEVIKAYTDYIRYSQNLDQIDLTEAQKRATETFENLIKAIRKDLGYKNEKILPGDVSRLFQ